ncbi:hypothetical protein GFS60_05389 [Rhodococcus sp. WAY2]|nr:hypothetical protein GFS60_05389 [Rhodococcus sp. WAY2]
MADVSHDSAHGSSGYLDRTVRRSRTPTRRGDRGLRPCVVGAGTPSLCGRRGDSVPVWSARDSVPVWSARGLRPCVVIG